MFPESAHEPESLEAASKPRLGKVPPLTPELLDKWNTWVRTGIDRGDPEFTLDLIQDRPRLFYLKEAPFRIQISDQEILSYNLIGRDPREMTLLGKEAGSCVLNFWFGDREDISKQTVLSILVNVYPDPERRERLVRVYKAMENQISEMFPDAMVCLTLVGDKLVVSGEVKDAVEATKILQIIRASTRRRRRVTENPATAVQSPVPPGQEDLNLGDPFQAPTMDDYILPGETRIVNLLRIPGEQQVQLRVTVAEVSRSAARNIGLNYNITNNSGIQVFANTTGGVGAIANLPTLIDNGHIFLAIQALRNVKLARSLAEPNLVALNGRTAFFQAGGEFPVPIVTGATAVGLQGTAFVPFGVLLSFTPIITDKDRIRLQVQATVSVRDVAIGTNIAGANVAGLNVRTITTTVDMREGQTFAIGGLLQTNFGSESTRVPLFGDLPYLGNLFGQSNTSSSESELVLLVTPELVHPMEPKEVPALPGSDMFEPSDLEFYLYGRISSRRPYDYRAPAMENDIHRMAAYRHCQLLYFVGPHGHAEEPPAK